MLYRVKEIFYSLQGEGIQAGRPSVFCRFSGCNLWSGLEEDRERSSCRFCDTDFVGTDGTDGGIYDSNQLVTVFNRLWPKGLKAKHLVFTGGEPLLQLDSALVQLAKRHGFETALETNGTHHVPDGIDWITVSPKPRAKLVQKKGSELKLLFPSPNDPSEFESLNFHYFLLSPLYTGNSEEWQINLRLATDYCLSHPNWRLTMQYHRIWNIR